MSISLVKTKFAALLIGTGGVGLLASFTAIQKLVQTIASLGINSSGVREIASAVAKEDQEAIGRAVLTLRRMCWLTGTFGMLTVAALSPLIGQLTFNSDIHNLEIAALGLIILLVNISSGQMALIQGSRRIGDIAQINIISAAIATIITIGFYFWLGLRGIVPALVISAAIQLLFSWYFARRVPIPHVQMSWRESFQEADNMVKLGVAMMWTGLMNSLVSYVTVTMISNQFNLHAVGIYSAAFSLSGMFVNFVLHAMGTDYYPRLVGVEHDKAAMNRMVNEQTEIGLLLAVPGILATLILAPWVIWFFYSKEFMPAVELLQWFVLGCFFRVFHWPMGFLQLALGRGRIWVATQTIFSVIHVTLIWVMIQFMGIEGASVAFLELYLIAIIIIKWVAKYLTGFKWEASLFRLIARLMLAVVVVFLIEHLTRDWWMHAISALILLLVSFNSLQGIVSRIGENHRISKALLRIPGIRRAVRNV